MKASAAPLRGREIAPLWKALQPWRTSLGISRVTAITRLDRLGLPVFASVRPRGRTLCVHAGKGFDEGTARLGALVEAIEIALAERDAHAPPDALATMPEMQRRWPVGLQPVHFAPQAGAVADPSQPVPALDAEGLEHGQAAARPVRLPAALFRLTPDEPPSPWFPWSSNGLSAGSSVDEATLHALLELLERDAVALHQARDESRRLLDLPPDIARWAQAWQAQGVHLHVRYLPNPWNLACFTAWLHQPEGVTVNLAEGSALHPDRHQALARAVAEAAQARLSVIHGGRDDVTRFFDKFDRPPDERLAAEAALMARIAAPAGGVRFSQVPQARWGSVGSGLAALRRRLAAQGLRWLFRHRLAWPAGPGVPPLAVVKLVVPGLEVLEPHNRRVGLRLMARLGGGG